MQSTEFVLYVFIFYIITYSFSDLLFSIQDKHF